MVEWRRMLLAEGRGPAYVFLSGSMQDIFMFQSIFLCVQNFLTAHIDFSGINLEDGELGDQSQTPEGNQLKGAWAQRWLGAVVLSFRIIWNNLECVGTSWVGGC